MSKPLGSPSIDLAAVTELLDAWIDRHISPDVKSWFAERLDKITAGDEKAVFLTFGMIPRKLGKADLEWSESDEAAIPKVRPGWNPTHWTVDQAARTRLLLALAAKPLEQFVTLLDKLFDSGEVGELVALYQALPVLPHQAAHASRTSEGTRTNIKSVFCAVAHHNPYPGEHLDENRWNQMVLKSLFIDAPLWPIVGLDERANPALAQMLVDYAHERWAAGRKVSPELWRCVGPHANETALNDLERVLENGSPNEQLAAALAVSQRHEAETLLKQHKELAEQIQSENITWNRFSQTLSSES